MIRQQNFKAQLLRSSKTRAQLDVLLPSPGRLSRKIAKIMESGTARSDRDVPRLRRSGDGERRKEARPMTLTGCLVKCWLYSMGRRGLGAGQDAGHESSTCLLLLPGESSCCGVYSVVPIIPFRCWAAPALGRLVSSVQHIYNDQTDGSEFYIKRVRQESDVLKLTRKLAEEATQNPLVTLPT
ncbi:LOW QUALITY PROTEIN: hypothetical protein U9M48_033169 [Paspalum notatum var. saurae]|uniref:Uncharacterized protein n=1 Tax=Paspalum notatum var. saurae TaxID=547442 RepID=A0AAQ3X6D5_PASNO